MFSEPPASVNAFFDSYCTAFERSDAAAIADHFAFPCHTTSDTGAMRVIHVADKAEWAGTIEQLLSMYRVIDVSSARVLALAVAELSPRLVQAVVHWGLHDSAGRDLYDFEATYTLAEIEGALRVAALAHNEIPRYEACVARLQSERAHEAGLPDAPPGAA